MTTFGTSGQPGSQTGIASLTWGGKSFRFRTNPNTIMWSYNLITSVQPTYGGRVVQVLGVNLGDLTVTIECGNGGWPYLMQVVNTMVEILQFQRNGTPATFEYTGRNYKMNVFAVSVPFQDDWQATVREVSLNFKIQEDVTGVASGLALDEAMNSLADGVYGSGAKLQAHNEYNDGNKGVTVTDPKLDPGLKGGGGR